MAELLVYFLLRNDNTWRAQRTLTFQLLPQIAPKTSPFGSLMYDLLEMLYCQRLGRLVMVSLSRGREYHNCPCYQI